VVEKVILTEFWESSEVRQVHWGVLIKGQKRPWAYLSRWGGKVGKGGRRRGNGFKWQNGN
jgi:hypothetical protein